MPAPASNDTESGRQLEHSLRRHRNDFGHRTAQHRQCRDPVTRCHVGAGGGAAHHAGDLGARHVRQFGTVLIEAARLQRVGKRHPGRAWWPFRPALLELSAKQARTI
jgi:hypothetical protein